LAESYGFSLFNFLRISILFSIIDTLCPISTNGVQGLQFLHIFSNIYVYFDFWFCVCVCVLMYICGFICLRTSDGICFLHPLFCVSSSLGMCLLKSFAHFRISYWGFFS
jgi:hypothetical protein